MAEAVAIVSIVSGAAVAVLVPFISARLERTRLVQQSRDARFEELRGIFDDALQTLYVGWTIFYEIQEWRSALPRPEWSQRWMSQRVSQLTEQVDKVNQDRLRIQLRTPEGAAVAAAQGEAADYVLAYEVTFRHFVEREGRDTEQVPPPPFNEMTVAMGRVTEEIRKFAGVVPVPLETLSV